jgi:polysaccharide export outer membrane protein
VFGVDWSNNAGRVSSRLVSAALLPLLIAACSALPASAPTTLELTATNNDNSDFDYALVRLDSRAVSSLNHFRPSFGPTFHSRTRYAASNAIAPGDVIAITVYETGGPSLFPPPAVVPGAAATQNTTGQVSTGASNIPAQVVEADGTVFVPFVGRTKVSGLTPSQAGEQIEAALQGKAVSPQVIVTPVNAVGSGATVNGEVNQPRIVPIGPRGERLLDVIAAAGGPKYPAYETYVQVMRRGQVGNVLLQAIVNDPAENIIVQPKDVIYVSRNPRTFTVLGASRAPSAYAFARQKVTLAEALAQAGGPIDQVGNPSGIFLFRFEPWPIAQELLPPEKLQAYAAHPPPIVPVLYQIDMRDARGYFLTQSVEMRDKDVLLVTNAEVTQLDKALITIGRGMSLINQGASAIYNVKRANNL